MRLSCEREISVATGDAYTFLCGDKALVNSDERIVSFAEAAGKVSSLVRVGEGWYETSVDASRTKSEERKSSLTAWDTFLWCLR